MLVLCPSCARADTAVRIDAFVNSPSNVAAIAKWTIVDGPVKPGPMYPMVIECLAAQCDVALTYAGNTAFSQACISASAQVPDAGSLLLVGGRVRLALGETVHALVCYTDDPRDGLFSYHNGSSPYGIGIESTAPIGDVVMTIAIPLHAGRTLLKLVNTTGNAALPSSLSVRRFPPHSLPQFTRHTIPLCGIGALLAATRHRYSHSSGAADIPPTRVLLSRVCFGWQTTHIPRLIWGARAASGTRRCWARSSSTPTRRTTTPRRRSSTPSGRLSKSTSLGTLRSRASWEVHGRCASALSRSPTIR